MMSNPAPENHDELEKSNLRASIKIVLGAMTAKERHDASLAACQKLMGLDLFVHAGAVMLYMPLTSEVDVSSIALRALQAGKTVCVPHVVGTHLRPVEITRFDVADMDLDDHGVRTPRDGAPVSPEILDLIVVPGLAFDSAGHRLGRGGGIYDRFLSRVARRTAVIAIAYDAQVVEHVPSSRHDVPVQFVVTDRRIITSGSAARSRGSSPS